MRTISLSDNGLLLHIDALPLTIVDVDIETLPLDGEGTLECRRAFRLPDADADKDREDVSVAPRAGLECECIGVALLVAFLASN
jgi:hypothetical protein